MMTRITCTFLMLLAPAVTMGQPLAGSAAERLSLETAIHLAIENNRHLQTAHLQVEKAEADLSAARTQRLPVFQTEGTASRLLTPVEFAFPQGAFGNFPGTGPIPAVDTSVSVPRQTTYYISTQASQPISQLFRIGLGIRGAAASRDIARERARGQQLSIINDVKRLYLRFYRPKARSRRTTKRLRSIASSIEPFKFAWCNRSPFGLTRSRCSFAWRRRNSPGRRATTRLPRRRNSSISCSGATSEPLLKLKKSHRCRKVGNETAHSIGAAVPIANERSQNVLIGGRRMTVHQDTRAEERLHEVNGTMA